MDAILDQFRAKVLEAVPPETILGISVMKREEAAGKPVITVLVLINDFSERAMPESILIETLAHVSSPRHAVAFGEVVPVAAFLSKICQMFLQKNPGHFGLIALKETVHGTPFTSAVKTIDAHCMWIAQSFGTFVESYIITGSLLRGNVTEGSTLEVVVLTKDSYEGNPLTSTLKSKLCLEIEEKWSAINASRGSTFKLALQIHTLSDLRKMMDGGDKLARQITTSGAPLFDRGWLRDLRLLDTQMEVNPSKRWWHFWK